MASEISPPVEEKQVQLGELAEVELDDNNDNPSAERESVLNEDRDMTKLVKYEPPVGWEKTRFMSNLAVNTTIFAQWSNLLVLPAIYDKLGDDLGFSTSQLGLLHTMRIFSMFATLPAYAWLCYRVSRRVLVSVTIMLAAFFTVLTVVARDYPTFMVINVLAGISLGAIAPVARSLIPNYYELAERGRYFGYLELSSGIGGFLGAGLGVGITTGTSAFGARADGSTLGCCFPWQTVFIVLGLILIPVSMFTWTYLVDPVHDTEVRRVLGKNIQTVFPGLHAGGSGPPSLADLKLIWKSVTFRCICLQGATGAFPWSGLSFLILWFGRMGINEILAVVIFALVGLGAAVGGLIGGIMGDAVYRSKLSWGEHWGRIVVAHVSVFSGIPYIACLMQAIPKTADYWGTYAIVGGLMGITIAWPPGNNSANHSDVLPQHVHPVSFAIQYWIEGCASSWSPFVVGVLTDYVFGAKDISPPGGIDEWNSFSSERQIELLQGMANSLMAIAVTMWFLCWCCYLPMYKYYPRESLSLQAKRRREARGKSNKAIAAVEEGSTSSSEEGHNSEPKEVTVV